MPLSKVTTLTSASIDQFLNSLSATGVSPHTARAYASDVSLMMEWSLTELGTKTTTSNFDNNATLWLNNHRKIWAARTTGRRVTALRSFAKVLKIDLEFLCDYNSPTPARARPHPIPEGIAGVVAMIETCKDDRRRAVIALCGLAGLRLHEALAIRPRDVNVASMNIHVRGKGEKDRDVPLTPRCLQYIRECLVEAILNGDNDEPMARYKDRFAREFITRAGRDAGLARAVSSHDLRATFLTAAYNKTLSIRAVQELAGHASSATTEGYIEVAISALRDAADV